MKIFEDGDKKIGKSREKIKDKICFATDQLELQL